MPRMLDLTGQTFGRLTALSPIKGKPNVRWQCQCSCGGTTVVASYELHTGKTKSCGCLRSEMAKARTGPRKAYSPSREPLYRLWMGMRARCNNSNSKPFRYYGGRGIKVCERWANYENFKADMGPRPPGFSIDRKDKDGNYEPGNCRWADNGTQANNRNANIPITHNGETMNLFAWSVRSGLSPDTLYARFHRGEHGDDLFRAPNSRLSDKQRANIKQAAEHSLAVRRARTHCRQGHAYEPDNVFLVKDARRCRICFAAKTKRYAAYRRERAEKLRGQH